MTIMEWLNSHSITDTLFIFWVFSAAVGALPTPDPEGHGLYRWFYEFITTVAGRLDDMMEARRAHQQAVQAGANQRPQH